MADAQASGACYGNIVWVQVPSPALLISDQGVMRKCRNWQTSKTKDLVVVTPCGFKSHLPQEKRQAKTACLFCFYLSLSPAVQLRFHPAHKSGRLPHAEF